jgi:hypothetical protein
MVKIDHNPLKGSRRQAQNQENRQVKCGQAWLNIWYSGNCSKLNRISVWVFVCYGLDLLTRMAHMRGTLFPGSMVTESGLHLISHSTGHRPDTEAILVQGLILPQCPTPGCSVSYSPVETARPVINVDRQSSKAEPFFDHSPQS